jgi:hypothetical protein
MVAFNGFSIVRNQVKESFGKKSVGGTSRGVFCQGGDGNDEKFLRGFRPEGFC